MRLGNRHNQSHFSMVPDAQIPRSKFNRSFQRKQTFDVDLLVPIYVDEVLPGDTFNLSLTTFARLATPIVPFMDNLYMDYFFFFVPNRLVWNNWQKFNGEQENPGDPTDYTIPLATATSLTVAENTLYNYMGLPKGTFNMSRTPISALPFRAYNLIYNEWFRDQNLMSSLVVPKDDGPDNTVNFVTRTRAKKHDYFTSCLPWPQKGPSVEIPLGTSAPVVVNPSLTFPVSDNTILRNASNGSPSGAGTVTTDASGFLLGGASSTNKYYDPKDTLIADLTDSAAGTINQLREAFQIQRLYERDARGGTRYIEIIRSHFGVVSPDARLQRPEYLGGGSVPVNVNPVAQTSSTDATTPQGNLAAYGTAIGRSIGFQKSFVEHGYIIGLANARADISYQQGINKMWTRQTRFDFFWPSLAHLGEQAVLNYEIYADGTSQDENVFGYQERFAEYRYKPSEILGSFMSTVTAPLDMWHLAEEFSTPPGLNTVFIYSNTPIERVIAVPSEPHFLWDGYFKLMCARPMPTFAVPGMVDHF